MAEPRKINRLPRRWLVVILLRPKQTGNIAESVRAQLEGTQSDMNRRSERAASQKPISNLHIVH